MSRSDGRRVSGGAVLAGDAESWQPVGDAAREVVAGAAREGVTQAARAGVAQAAREGVGHARAGVRDMAEAAIVAAEAAWVACGGRLNRAALLLAAAERAGPDLVRLILPHLLEAAGEPGVALEPERLAEEAEGWAALAALEELEAYFVACGAQLAARPLPRWARARLIAHLWRDLSAVEQRQFLARVMPGAGGAGPEAGRSASRSGGRSAGLAGAKASARGGTGGGDGIFKPL